MVRRLLAVVVGGALAVACASPTLPLPPPEVPTISQGDKDHVHLAAGCGGVQGGAIVVVENRNTSVANNQRVTATLASGCGAWSLDAFAHTGDVFDITQVSGGQSSQATTVQVPTL